MSEHLEGLILGLAAAWAALALRRRIRAQQALFDPEILRRLRENGGA